MNNHKREERRKLQERRERQRDEFACCSITRPHRACERECLDQKARIKALESLLARAGCELTFNPWNVDNAKLLIKEIDVILPATEKYVPQTKLSPEYE